MTITNDEAARVVPGRSTAHRAYLEGFDEGEAHGYALAGGEAVMRVLALRAELATLSVQFEGDKWDQGRTFAWACRAVDVIRAISSAISGEDGDESPDAVVFADAVAERARQDRKWGTPTDRADGTGPNSHPLVLGGADNPGYGYGPFRVAAASSLADTFKHSTDARASSGDLTWRDILLEEVFEALAESDPAKLRVELVQVSAVAVKWVRMIDRRGSVESGDLDEPGADGRVRADADRVIPARGSEVEIAPVVDLGLKADAFRVVEGERRVPWNGDVEGSAVDRHGADATA
ncbi:hypothetical protein [Microbacterium rhizomatis]|uniref:hypothetical protein n=1 Tax=Microbacterium rhizomatis TaxID=1631477 RepID=UPI001B87D43A|nr:hypothetical protein [Microbacterium rhizomatis]